MKLSLTKKEKRELLDGLGLEHDRRSADRIRAILLLDQGESVSDIANFLFLNETTIRNYKSRYNDGGIEGLVTDDYVGRSSYSSKDQKGELNKELESRVYPTTKSIISFVKDRFCVKYTVNGMTSLLHNLYFSYKKTTGVPGKADIDQQRAMANTYFPDVETFQKELMLFLRGVRQYRPELSTLITANFHLIET